MKQFLTIIISVSLSILGTLLLLGSSFNGGVGASVTTLTGTDQLSNFPTTYNANLNALNDSKFELSDWFATTTATQITTLGTITSGTWQGTTIDDLYGGTGFSTYSTGDLLYSSSANTLSKLTASSTGEVLTLEGGVPIWKDQEVNTNQDFSWLGLHTFNATTTMSTTTVGKLTVNNEVGGVLISDTQYLGDGHDGDVTISSNTSLTEDKYYSSLTIDSGAELDPNGYKIFVKGTLTVDNGKIIRTGNNGSNGGNGENGDGVGGAGAGGSGGSGGSALSAGSLEAGQAGASGGGGGQGAENLATPGDGGNADGSNVSHSLGNDGANGGDGGTAGGNIGTGTGGTAIEPTRPLTFGFPLFEFADVDLTGDGIIGYESNAQSAGGGGGAGGSGTFGGGSSESDGGGGGGGGGAGSDGGTILVYAKDIVVNASGTIEANGGSGGNGGTGGDGASNEGGAGTGGGGGGGGAGGNGGLVVLVYTNSYTNSGTVQATGGSAGSGGTGGSGVNGGSNGGDGANGSAGASGTIITKEI